MLLCFIYSICVNFKIKDFKLYINKKDATTTKKQYRINAISLRCKIIQIKWKTSSPFSFGDFFFLLDSSTYLNATLQDSAWNLSSFPIYLLLYEQKPKHWKGNSWPNYSTFLCFNS